MLHHPNYTLLSRQTSYYKQEYSTKKPSQGTKIGSSRDQKYTLHISANSLPLDPLSTSLLFSKSFLPTSIPFLTVLLEISVIVLRLKVYLTVILLFIYFVIFFKLNIIRIAVSIFKFLV